MKPSSQPDRGFTPGWNVHARARKLIGLTGLCLIAVATRLTAQDQPATEPAPEVAPPPPETARLPQDLQQPQVGGTQVVSPLASAPSRTRETPPLKWGFLSLQPTLSNQFMDASSLQIRPGQQESTTIDVISAGLLFNFGNHWTLDYSPTQTYYSTRFMRDTFDQSARFNGTTTYGAWTFGLSESYADTMPVLVETAQQTKQRTWLTTVDLAYELNSRLLLDTSFSYNSLSADVFNSSRAWSTSDYLHFAAAPELDLALGVGAGYIAVAGPDMTYTRPQAQVGWRPTRKLTLDVQTGVENRKFRSGNRGDLSSLTFGASLTFRPVDTTSLTLGSTRSVAPSYFTDQITRGTDWTIGLDQRLLEVLRLGLSYGEQKTSYLSTATASSGLSRSDTVDSLGIRLSTVLLRRGTLALLYSYTHDASNDAAYSFNSHQVGLEVGWRF